jgi:2-isopropylmalate synthase
VARRLDELGVHYVEGGYPLSNPKDQQFFERVPDLELRQAKIAAFGSTRKAGNQPEHDKWLRVVLEAETPVITIVAKGWDYHVEEVIRTDLDENLRMVEDSVRYLKEFDREVVLDVEHFFDGYKSNPEYTLKVARVAAEAGADVVCLCDTNGGSLTWEVQEATSRVAEAVDCQVGIHCHNDCGLSVANSVASVRAGAVHVQGTMNGIGERAGNADLCSIIPIVNAKMGQRTISDEQMRHLTETSRFVYEAANHMYNSHQPFVGASAFAHKGGLHVDAMRKADYAYEHMDPTLVGNERRFLVSELSGRASMLEKVEKFDITHEKHLVQKLLDEVQNLEAEGYQFEAAEASFELLAKKIAGHFRPRFEPLSYHVSCIKKDDELVTDATVKIVVDGELMHTAAEGDGPVNALDGALRKALEPHFESLTSMHLSDYRVRVINASEATAAKVRVVIQSTDGHREWGTVGVHENIIDASWQALMDSIEYRLLMTGTSSG